jgi:Flp pilus assembly protein TadG
MGKHAGRRRQRGGFAVVFAATVVLLLAALGMALDLGRIYNRRAELQAVADAAALAAARQLNGTAAGVSNALLQASNAASALRYQYNQLPIAWSDGAMSFSSAANGNWVDAATAQANPAGLRFARADSAGLAASPGTVELVFMRLLSDALASSTSSASAVAGRSTIRVEPLAVCAMSPLPAAPRANPGAAAPELVEYGFRRGVSYDLMQLNPDGSSAENFVLSPFDRPGTPGTAANVAAAVVAPYVCTGQLAMPTLGGGALTVGRPFPLAALFNQLNSRFDQYVGAQCAAANAPPDSNIKSYAIGGGVNWMTVAPTKQGAQSTPVAGVKLWTAADPFPTPAGTTAAMFGTLWAYAKAVQYAAVEPAGGYLPFLPGDWATLYNPGLPAVNANYTSALPYRATTSPNFLAPSLAHRPGIANRRVLNVALLACPVAPGAVGTASVRGIGRFFMTVPATATSVFAEFAGLVPEQSLGGTVTLFP